MNRSGQRRPLTSKASNKKTDSSQSKLNFFPKGNQSSVSLTTSNSDILSASLTLKRSASQTNEPPTKKVSSQSNARFFSELGSSDGFESGSGESDLSQSNPVNFKNPILSRGSSFKKELFKDAEIIEIEEFSTPSTSRASSFYGSSQSTTISSQTTMSAAKYSSSTGAGSERMMSFFGNKMQNPRIKADSPFSGSKSSSFEFSDEQKAVIKYVVDDRKNVFYTGSAGTGKSAILNEVVKRLGQMYGLSAVAVTASTGLAAYNIGGQTINRFAGIGLGNTSAQELITKIKKVRQVSERWKKTKVLIIDEISMIDGKLFTKLNQIAQAIRGNMLPFGGIQVILTGDFFQLPPVPNRDGPKPTYCFQSECWAKVVSKTILLTKVFRQKGDSDLIEMLNSLRYGELDPKVIAHFKALEREVKYEDGIDPTELYPTKYYVNRANDEKLRTLGGRPQIYKALDSATTPHLQQLMGMLDNLMCEKELVLKEDAQVMCIKNIDESLVNGSLGKVLFFATEGMWRKLQEHFRDSDYDHKELLDQVRLISTCVGMNSIPNAVSERLSSFPHFYRSKLNEVMRIAIAGAGDLMPVVSFKVIGGCKIYRIDREEFTVDLRSSTSDDKLMRVQVPLLLAWAMSIHKSQGQTLDRVKVDLTRSFEKGQVYVALSRAVNKDRLQILGFDPAKIRASEEVKQFYNKLQVIR